MLMVKPAMTESEFNDLIDETFETLETALDEVEDDIDYETTGGVLTVSFENGTSLVFSRQPPTRQLWLAARSGGFHFAWDTEAGDWCDTRDGKHLRPFVVSQMQEQGGVDFAWS
jgi:CyaY protein